MRKLSRYYAKSHNSHTPFLVHGSTWKGKFNVVIYFLWRYSKGDWFQDKSFAFEVEHDGHY